MKSILTLPPFGATLLLLFLSISLFAQKNDTIRLQNGDRITGEFKKLEYAIVSFNTDDMGTLQIEWEEVASVQTNKFFEIYLNDNSTYFGKIDSSFTGSPRIRALMDMEGTERYLDLIIKVIPIKMRFLDRVDIDLELGFQYNKGSNVASLNTGYNFYYRNLKNGIRVKGTNHITDQRNENELFKKQDVNFSYDHFMKKSWKVGAFSTAEQNTELNLDLRALVGLDVGKTLAQSLHSELQFATGPLANIENSTEGNQSNNLEGKFQIAYQYFRFNYPEIKITADVTTYKSINVSDRVRVDSNINAKIELIRDIYFSLTFYQKFDSKPLDATANKNDFGITTGLAYSF